MAVTYPGYIQAQFTIPEDISIFAGNGSTTIVGEDEEPLMSMIEVTIPAGTCYLTGSEVTTPSLLETIEDALNAAVGSGGWTVTLDESTGYVTIDCTDDDWALTFDSTELRDLLGFAGDIAARSTPATGTIEAIGIWLPDAQGVLDASHLAAPITTDSMQSESPDGFMIGHVGNSKREHLRLVYSHCPVARVIKRTTSTEHQSLTFFLRTAQWQMGHSWFVATSKCCIKLHDGNFVGGLQVDGWQFRGLASEAELSKRVQEAWDGVWRVEFPSLVSNG